MISRVTEALSKVKGSMGSHERHALPGVIGDDLLRFGKLPLCLFICIILTAVTVVTLKRMRSATIAGWKGSPRKSCKCSMLIRHKKIS